MAQDTMLDARNDAKHFDRSAYMYDGMIVISKPEALTVNDPPAILLNKPEWVAPVELPLVEHGASKVRYGMHTDMLTTMIRSLQYDTTEKTQKELYIHGRMPTVEQWKKLEDNVVYNFFLKSRSARIRPSDQRMARLAMDAHNVGLGISDYKFRLIIPRNIVMTPTQVRNYIGMEYGPTTRILGLEDMRSAWYQAKWLIDVVGNSSFGANVLLSTFGGMNKFEVGSTALVPGQVRKAAYLLRQKFDNAILEISQDQPVYTEDQMKEFAQYEL